MLPTDSTCPKTPCGSGSANTHLHVTHLNPATGSGFYRLVFP